MFGISWNEYLLIAVVALIVIGPKDLPRVLRAVGQWTAKIRRMAAEFQGQFQEALREAEMADLKKEVDTIHSDIHDAARGFTSQFNDPLGLEDATKWEPKPDAAPDAAKPVDPVETKPDDATHLTNRTSESAASAGHEGGGEPATAAPAEPAAEMAGAPDAAPAVSQTSGDVRP